MLSSALAAGAASGGARVIDAGVLPTPGGAALASRLAAAAAGVVSASHNPYPDNASEPPWVQHNDLATVGQGDLGRLLRAIADAFEGTAQPQPGERRTTVWYLETGFQTTVPRGKKRFYRGEETDSYVVPPLSPTDAEPWDRDQASQLRDALLLARCQRAVGAFFNFELLDEDRLAGWQSGLLWRDGTPKPSYDAFKDAVAQVRSGRVDCATVAGVSGAPMPPERPRLDSPGVG